MKMRDMKLNQSKSKFYFNFKHINKNKSPFQKEIKRIKFTEKKKETKNKN